MLQGEKLGEDKIGDEAGGRRYVVAGNGFTHPPIKIYTICTFYQIFS